MEKIDTGQYICHTTAPTIPFSTALRSLLKVQKHVVLSVAFAPVTPPPQ